MFHRNRIHVHSKMSHPFTPEYMMDESQIKSRPSSRMSENQLATNGRENDSVEEPQESLEHIREAMNITILDTEMMGFFRLIQIAMRRRMQIFAEEVSIVGLSYLVKPSLYKVGSIIRKVIWTMLLLFGTGFMIFQIYDRTSYYLTYPTIVNYRLAYNRSLRFPTVTICPEFIISLKALLTLGPKTSYYASISYPPLWDLEFGDSYRAINLSQLHFDWESFYNYVSIKIEDLMFECSFGNLPCKSGEAIRKTATEMGYCYSLDTDRANYVVTHPGAKNGLRLVLWVNQSDCFLTSSPGVGFRVVLHDAQEEPIAQMTGFRVGTGISTSVSVSLRNVTMLPSPYGDCRQGGNYTFMRCITKCGGELIVSECKCRSFHFEGRERVCSIDKYYHCVMKITKLWISSGAMGKCDCPLQCHQPTYPFSISTSPLSKHFLNYMSQKSQFKGRNLTMSKLSKELVYLDIFYSQLSYVDIQTTPAYDFLTLVCDVSGALGLILGGTLLTVVELFQFVFQLFSEIITAARFASFQRR